METNPPISPLNAHLHRLAPNARHHRYLELAEMALTHYALHAPHPVYLQHNSGIALLAGYRQVRPLPDTCRRDLDAALIVSAMGNLAFQITIPEQWTSIQLTRNLRQLVDTFCQSFIAEIPIMEL